MPPASIGRDYTAEVSAQARPTVEGIGSSRLLRYTVAKNVARETEAADDLCLTLQHRALGCDRAILESAVIELHPLSAIDEVEPGDDLARLLARAINAAGLLPVRSDVLVVTQKVVSKAEGCFVELASVTPSPRAIELAQITRKDARFVELVLAQSVTVLRAVPNVLITRHRSGHVMANAGVDRSNAGPGNADRVLLLPADSDASAERLRAALRSYWLDPPAVVISDSFGRPWRNGVTNVAIGASGLPALVDRRGDTDRDGRKLEVTQVALGDMIAAASGLVSGEAAEGIPAVLLRGLRWEAPERRALALVRPLEEDLFQ